MIGDLTDHLWQSTFFACAVGLLALLLRKNRSQIRYGLWLAASVKFLLPFSLLVTLGSHIGRRSMESGGPFIGDGLFPLQPFMPNPFAIEPAAQPVTTLNLLPLVLCAVWAIGFAILAFSWWLRWRRIRRTLRTASPLDLSIGVKAMSSTAFLEPGVFGVLRPVLLLPEGIADQLTAPQLEAILAHELCHIRRRDNLVTAIHMVVEAVFWFHPLVWWIGARLMAERERACDEQVLRLGADPEVYAEGILKICELYVESPLKFVAGVKGGNLKKRIEAIMSNRTAVGLNFIKRFVLAVAGIAAITVPIVVGAINAPIILAQSEKRQQLRPQIRWPEPKFAVEIPLLDAPPLYEMLTAKSDKASSTIYGEYLRRTTGGNSQSRPATAMELKYKVEGDSVSITALIFLDQVDPHDPEALDKLPHKNAGTYSAKLNESVTLSGLAQYGLEPLTLKIVSPEPDVSVRPQTISKVPSIQMEIVREDRESYTVALHNSSTKGVTAYSLTDQTMEGMGRDVIAPGATRQEHIGIPRSGRIVNGIYVEDPPLTTMVLEAAFFNDGSYEGDPQAAAFIAAMLIGRETQDQRVGVFMDAILADAKSGDNARVKPIRSEIAQLTEEPDAALGENMRSRFPGLSDKAMQQVKSGLSIGLNAEKQQLTRSLKNFEQRNWFRRADSLARWWSDWKHGIRRDF